MIVKALIELGYGSCSWSVRNEEIYDNLNWSDKSVEKPSREVIDNKIAELTTAEPLRQLRIQRNQLLAQTDWRMTTDYPYSDQAAWASYRTSLRNLPATAEPTLDENGTLVVDWPTPPDAT